MAITGASKMALYKKAADLSERIEIRPNVNKSKNSIVNVATAMASLKATFLVLEDEDGHLSAADMEQGIFTDGRDEEELMENINRAVECHFNVPRDMVSITIRRGPN
jgi:predicted RNase H-like HicB family nuclease